MDNPEYHIMTRNGAPNGSGVPNGSLAHGSLAHGGGSGRRRVPSGAAPRRPHHQYYKELDLEPSHAPPPPQTPTSAHPQATVVPAGPPRRSETTV